MKKYIKHFFVSFVLSFAVLVIVPLIAWLVIQAVIFMGHLTEIYVSFLGNYFIEPVAELVSALSILLFLASIILGCILACSEFSD